MMPMRILFLTIASLVGSFCHAGEQRSSQPNIIVIVADDLGYGELTCQGFTKEIYTPNIDSIATNGVRFTNGYVSCPVCSPTRAGIMTGRYQQRFGHEFNPGPPNVAAEQFGLPLTETTLPDRLKEAGYATGMVGKWHLGYRPAYRPQQRGFDEFFGFLGGAHSYLNSPAGINRAILRGNEQINEKEYLTDAFAREAVQFIDKHQKQPFFLYMPFNAVHAPLQATADYRELFPGIKNANRLTFAAMLAAMDEAVGKILKKVRSLGLEENTTIIFISDNGGPTRQTTSGNGPLSGYKTQVLEGGIRIPFMMQWKGHLPEGVVYDKPVISLDIHPTALAAAGIEISKEMKFDGVNLLPFLLGTTEGSPHERLFWRFGEQQAIRQGNWKMLKMTASWKLYDLARDIGEKNDLANEKKDVVGDLEKAWNQWNSELVKPLWKRGSAE